MDWNGNAIMRNVGTFGNAGTGGNGGAELQMPTLRMLIQTPDHSSQIPDPVVVYL